MADTSPGKVQALRAMFAQKNEPVMGMIPLGNKGNRPWRRTSTASVSSQEDGPILKSFSEDNTPLPVSSTNSSISPAKLKVLPSVIKQKAELNSVKNREPKNETNSVLCDKQVKMVQKPWVGPKPVCVQQSRNTTSINATNSLNISHRTVNGTSQAKVDDEKHVSESNGLLKNNDKSRTVGEMIASFMLSNDCNNIASTRTDSRLSNELKGDSNSDKDMSASKLNKCSTTNNVQSHTENLNSPNGTHCVVLPKTIVKDSCSDLISSDNYICKSSCNFKRKELPPKDKLGPAPLKPVKPPNVKLPVKWGGKAVTSCPTIPQRTAPLLPQRPSHSLPQKPVHLAPQKPVPSIPQRPSYPCPPRPLMSPPLPPSSVALTPVISSVMKSCESSVVEEKSLVEELEELYEDTLLNEKHTRPVSLIPEYTEEEELSQTDAEELYDDAGEEPPALPISPFPTKPKNPPPPPPGSPSNSLEDLYQDAVDPNQEEFYEVMPVDLPQEDQGPLYSNNKKELEKLRREEEKRIRREQKEREKKEKEVEKIRKKFGLTGEEVPIDAGLVKADNKGGRNDLPVRKGETVLILRMENNPSGKWLVKNEKGKIGYVELTNIEVDPDSVKSVMTYRRVSIISASEELYSEALSEEEEEEGIYEVTY